MHPIVYYSILFLVVGAIGMAIANRRADKSVRRHRWLKYFTYIILAGIVVPGIFYDFIQWLAGVIAAASFIELWKINFSKKGIIFFSQIISVVVLIVVAIGFIFFSDTYKYSFLLFIYFQVLVFDGFCQIAGQLVGRHKLAPKISAAKTVEGLIGGLIFCLIAALMAAKWVNISFSFALFFGLLTGLSSFAGDMTASWYKRKMNVKDYSNWLPGQGGFLDRFDSFLMTGAVYYLLYILIFREEFISFVK